MKNSKKVISLLMASALVFTSTPHNLTVNALTQYNPGVTVEKNSTGKSDADYQATFVYEDQDERDAVSVSVTGSLQFYKHDDITDGFINTGTADGAKVYDAFHYEKGMFNTGYGLNGDSQSYELTEVEDERFEVTLPFPGNLYYYDYVVTYEDGSQVTIQDPANKSESNPASKHDSGHSIFYVGNSNNTAVGQEKIYPRTDEKKGTYSFVEYQAVDGTKQPLGVYLPKDYDSSKLYKTIYVSHGGGGNEVEWMGIGAVPNIMDNLIAENEVAESVVVTMDNSYFGWNYDTISKNFKENIIPYIEQHYSVSMNVKDRALCGLSMGSMTTSTILLQNTELFGAYGCFSGANTQATIKNVDELKNVKIYLTGGNVDMATKATTPEGDVGNPGKTVGLAKILTNLGVNYEMDIKDGAHDWAVWRAAFTTFVKDYLWDTNDILKPAGVSVENNIDFSNVKDAPYQATFIFEDTDQRNAVSVNVQGGFQFYKEDEIGKYEEPDDPRTPVYNAYQYKEGMFPTGYVLDGSLIKYDMTEVKDERFEISLPLPGNLYYYDYEITYDDGTTVVIQDPANKSPSNNLNGHDCGHSLLYVGDKNNTASGQEYVYARNDKNGSLHYDTYTSLDGTEQPLGIYLPYGYDSSKVYKTIYVSHGGGGNETDWMTIGALPNIMDNLIADKEIDETIVITMDNTYYSFDAAKTVDNLTKNIIPYVENNYSVSKKSEDRAICGLSAGGTFTANALVSAYKEFGYYGVWSPRNTVIGPLVEDGTIGKDILNEYKNNVYYIGVGNLDISLRQNQEKLLYDTLINEGISASIEHKNGAHDWYVWRDLFTTFAKDYLWDVKTDDEGKEDIADGNIEDNTNTNTSDKTNNKSKNVKTGDEMSLTPYVSTLFITLASMILLVNKRIKDRI